MAADNLKTEGLRKNKLGKHKGSKGTCIRGAHVSTKPNKILRFRRHVNLLQK